MKTYKVVTLTTVGNGTWTVPDDWNNDENEIHMIGGGGGGLGDGGGFGRGMGGGGGGAYGFKQNYQATPGSGINYTVGAGGYVGYISPGANGGNTFFGTLSVGGGNTPDLGSNYNFGAGGSYFSGSFTLTRNGGNGGAGTTSGGIGGGGGGAGGFNGTGISGNTYSSGAYSCDGGSGDGGFGGARGSQNSSMIPPDATVSIGILNRLAGSGGGGAGSYPAINTQSGNGGKYGGGGGGFGPTPTLGTGAQGIIVIFWAVENYFPEAGYYCVTENLNRFFIKEYEVIDQFVGEQLWVCGYNNAGQLGDGNFNTSRSSPVTTIAGGTNWKQVACGINHTAAIKTDGTLWVWGDGYSGKLGDNNGGFGYSTSSPHTTAGTNATNWKQVACGTKHTAAIKTDGTLWGWGLNSFGNLGDGTLNSRLSPVTTIAGGTNWKSVSCGYNFCLAIKTDNTLWAWGSNPYGNLGDGTTISKSSPVQITSNTNWKQVSCALTNNNSQSAAAIKTDGTLWAWGYNLYGNLGDGTSSSRLSPVQITANTNWKQVSAGGTHTAAIKTDGTLWVTGNNQFGQLGTNDTSNYSSPVTTVAGGTNWKQVSSGKYYTAAIKTDGTLWVWGYNNKGQLSVNNTISYSSPTQTIAATINWKQISCGYNFTAAIGD